MIEIKSLTKSYDKPVLHGVDLTIEDGSIYGLIGVNGAGKTTLLDIISGIMEPGFGICLIDNGFNLVKRSEWMDEVTNRTNLIRSVEQN